MSLSAMTVMALTASAGVGVAAQPAEPGSQRSATGQANSQAVAGTRPARAQSRATPRKKTTTAPQRSRSAGGTGRSSGGGANVSGPYDPSGVGLPSGNGRSASNNGNRPCAGCVGKADAKNPPGQLPGGSDSNRGYECDENQGIGKTNPAHSRCSPTRASGSPTGPGPSRTVALGSITPAMIAKVPPLAAMMAPQVSTRTPALKPTGAVLGAVESSSDPAVRGRTASPAPTAEELAFTGLGLAWMALLGAAFTAGGGALRRRTAPAKLEEPA